MKYALILLLSIFALQNTVYAQTTTSNCTVCLANYATCLTSTTYQVCINGVSYGDVQTCDADTFCSDASSVCVPANSTTAEFVCGTTSNGGDTGTGSCGQCSDGDTFTCVDKTHFTMCANPDIYMACTNAGEVCIKELLAISNKICALETALAQIDLSASCTNDETTPTPGPTTTPSLSDAAAACLANKPTTTVKYFFISNASDTTCRTYIYCEPNGTAMDPTILTCSANKYYDNAKQSCVTTFVTGCDSTATTVSI